MLPDGARTIAYGLKSDGTRTDTRPFAGLTRSTRPGLFSARSSVPAGSRSIEVGSKNVSGFAGARRTRTDPSRDVAPPTFALNRHPPAAGNTRRARYEPR